MHQELNTSWWRNVIVFVNGPTAPLRCQNIFLNTLDLSQGLGYTGLVLAHRGLGRTFLLFYVSATLGVRVPYDASGHGVLFTPDQECVLNSSCFWSQLASGVVSFNLHSPQQVRCTGEHSGTLHSYHFSRVNSVFNCLIKRKQYTLSVCHLCWTAIWSSGNFC